MSSKMAIFKATIFAAAAFVGIQAAPGPVIEDLADVTSRDYDGNLYVCVNAPWTQPCQNLGFFVDQCTNLGFPYANSISSAGPDEGFVCLLFKDINCSAAAISIVKPGIENLSGTGFNDQISSYKCSHR